MTIEVDKIESLEIDDSAIALVLSIEGRISPEARMNMRKELTASLPRLNVPVLILDAGARLSVIKALDAKVLSELVGDDAL